MKKKKRNLTRRILTILLTALVVSTALPASAFAEEISETGTWAAEEISETDAWTDEETSGNDSWTVEELPAEEAETLPADPAVEVPSAEETAPDFTELSETPYADTAVSLEQAENLYADTGITPEQLHDLNFHSKRILVGTDDPGIFVDPSVVISSFRNTYLLQFPDEVTARAAYAYYFERVDFIEVDTGIEVAQPEEALQPKADTQVTTETFMTGETNPFRELQTQLEKDKAEQETVLENEEEPKQPVYDIALIDTGVPTDADVDAISLIGEDPADDNGHGADMLARIREQNADANVLSIKALDKDGKGDVSAVYAAIEYAIEKDARIINLSVSAVASPDNCILEQAVALAKEKGIRVVGAAGNNGKDAKYYIPGSNKDAWIIGACDENGVRLKNSNYGETVDLNAVADSTSDAAALFSGWLSVYGEDAIPSSLGQGLLFSAEEKGTPKDGDAPDTENTDFHTAYNFVISDVTDLQGYDYYIRPQDVGLGNPNMVFTNTLASGQGYYELVKNAKWMNWTNGTLNTMNTAILYRSPGNFAQGKHTIPQSGTGGFELRWPEAAKTASGVGYDVVLTVTQLEIETAVSQEPDNKWLVMSGDGDSLTWQTHVMEGMNPCPTGFKVAFRIRVCKPGTNTPAPGTFYFGTKDIDQPDYYHWAVDNIAAHGDYWNHGGEWSAPDSYFHRRAGDPYDYTESFLFKTAPSSTIYFQSGTPLQNVNSERFYATWYDDAGSFLTGFVCKAPCSGITLQWTGSDCGSSVFVGTPGSYNIKAWVVGDVGGEITKKGYTYYYPGQNSGYEMTPDSGWEIEYVKVDGTQIPTQSSYNFNNIQANHTICVKYRHQTGNLTLSNTVNNGTLKVTKSVGGTGGETSKAFTFKATTLSSSGTYKKYNSNGTQVTSGAGSGSGTSLAAGGTFTLMHGQYILLSLPAGTQYVITETADDHYTTSGSPVSGTIKANQAFTYTVNIKNSGSNVSGLEMPYTGSKSGTATTNSSGNAAVTLSGGQSITLTAIPSGYTYTVTQTAVTGFNTTPSSLSVSGTKTTATQTAAFTNTPAQVASTVTNTHKTGNLKLTNTVPNGTLKVAKNTTKDGADKTKAFTFKATTLSNSGSYKKYNADGTQVSSGAGSGSGTSLAANGTFTLAHGQYILLSLPAGTQYVITETADDDYRTSGSPVSGTIKANQAFTYTVNIKNGSTNVSGLSMPYTGSKSGTATTNSSGNATIQLSGGQDVTLTNIPTGYTYTVTQTAVSGFNTTPSSLSVTGTKTTAVQTAAFTNTPAQVSATVENAYHGLGSHFKLTVKKVVTGNMGNRAKVFHFHMTMSKQYVNLYDAVITYKKTLHDGTVQTGRVTLTNNACDFTLTHGDQIEFTGIPDKTNYVITETEANTEGYVTSVTGAASGSLTADTAVQYKNHRQMAVPTKVKIMTIGGIALITALMAACGIYIVLFVRRKQKGAK